TTFFDHVIRQGSGRLPELFSADYTFLSDELAAFYRISGPVSGSSVTGLLRMDLEGSGRGGLLTHGSLLASQATPQTSSPVRRGKLVRERLLCQPLPPPPPGLNVELPPVDASLPNRERFREHSKNPACASCHQLMDPIGFGFEHFDSVGRYQPTQNEQPVDASGEVRSSPHTEGAFTGVGELQRKLAESPDVHTCFSLQWMRFAYGTSEEESSCAARQLAERFQQGGLSIPELLVSLTQLPRFSVRTGESTGTPGQPPPGGGTPGSDPQPSGNVQVAVSVQGDWEAGYCHDVKVTNTGTDQLAWRVSLSVEGTLTHVWNAVATPEAGRTTFTGADWNHLLEPGRSTSFGYCAQR
ncbi:MAG TPA: DUF1588 domain-containing protein, partial [Myxococcaceae bacterium]|nr:DUF1588 domain-containing protein [Myxococcaceae bacterium]